MSAESVGVYLESVMAGGFCLKPVESPKVSTKSCPFPAPAPAKNKKGPGCPGPWWWAVSLCGLNSATAEPFPANAVFQRRDSDQRQDAAVANEGFHTDWALGRKQKHGAGHEGAEDCR